METMNITFRMNKADKQQFERIISEIGLNLSFAKKKNSAIVSKKIH